MWGYSTQSFLMKNETHNKTVVLSVKNDQTEVMSCNTVKIEYKFLF